MMTAQVFAAEVSALIGKEGTSQGGQKGALAEESALIGCRNMLKLMSATPNELSLEHPERYDFSRCFIMHRFPETWKYKEVLEKIQLG